MTATALNARRHHNNLQRKQQQKVARHGMALISSYGAQWGVAEAVMKMAHHAISEEEGESGGIYQWQRQPCDKIMTYRQWRWRCRLQRT